MNAEIFAHAGIVFSRAQAPVDSARPDELAGTPIKVRPTRRLSHLRSHARTATLVRGRATKTDEGV